MKHRTPGYVLPLILALCAIVCASACVTAPDGTRSSSAVMSFTVTDDAGHAVALARSDLNTTIVFGAGKATGEVFQKPSETMPAGFPLFGPVGTAFGKVYVHDRKRDIKVTLARGEPLPAVCRVLFRPGEAEALGFTFVEDAAHIPATTPTP